MNGDAHVVIMASAFEALPEPMRRSLAPLRPLVDIVGNYPDMFDDPTRPDSEKDRDDPNWRHFCRYPAGIGGTSQHYWPDPIFDQARCRPMIAYLLGHAVAARQSGDDASFLKFVGCLSHYAGDVCQPIHTVDEALMAELMPAPPELTEFHFHRDIEAVTGACDPLAGATLLGATVEEAAWRIAQANLQSIVACRPFVIPTLAALFADDMAGAVRLAGPPVTRAAQSTLDILYTALRLAGEDEASLSVAPELVGIDLRTWQPDAEKQSSAYGGAMLDASRATPPAGAPIIPAALRLENGEIAAVRGLGVMPTVGSDPHSCWMTYGLPAGVFGRFDALVGLHTGLTTVGGAAFIVELDGREVHRSGPMDSHTPARPMTVEIGPATELTLKVADVNGGTTYFDNHAVWAEPRLVRAATA